MSLYDQMKRKPNYKKSMNDEDVNKLGFQYSSFSKRQSYGKMKKKTHTFGTSPEKIDKNLFEREYIKEFRGRHSPPSTHYSVP